MKNNPFAFFIDQLQEKMPEALRPLNAEMKKASQRLLHDRAQALDLVSRADFVAQTQALASAEQRLAALEARLAALQAEDKHEPSVN